MEIQDRVLEAAGHILKTGATVRVCAKKFGVSKTTIHKDMRERLPKIDRAMAKQVDKVLKKNMEERHIRGGMATKARYAREDQRISHKV